ncbi:hypothetical protein AO382_2117 [Moraxella catarrhalis]|uniref:Uncharacterized protein n=2 Tax=Moraxellaceae TaxID=468 RepID=A0A7Z0UWJ4_MORCA|nr:hypothetical protein AO382_2117 [Moraxella catarrhalis]
MIVGSTAGGYLGHRIDNMDWNELGENYKNNIDQQIKRGIIPPG